MSVSLTEIWKPVGKAPSGLWAGETSNANDVFMTFYRYFETHSEYTFEYLGSNYNDEILRSFSSMQLARIAKWLAHFGLVLHYAEHVTHVDPHDENKKVLMHTIKPTPKGYQVIENGEIFDIGQSHSDSHKTGVGKAYPSCVKSRKWLNDAYLSNKVAQWRQEKWWSDFNRLYYDNLEKTAEEMQRILSKWLMEKLSTIPARHHKTIKTTAQFDSNNAKITDFSVNKYQIEIKPPNWPGYKYCLDYRKNFGDHLGGITEFKTKEALITAVQKIFREWEENFNIILQKESQKVSDKTLAFNSFTDEITKGELFGNKRIDSFLKVAKRRRQ